MDDSDWLVGPFEAHRSHLRSVAYRMLGSLSEADDTAPMAFVVRRGKIVAIDALADRERLRHLDLSALDSSQLAPVRSGWW